MSRKISQISAVLVIWIFLLPITNAIANNVLNKGRDVSKSANHNNITKLFSKASKEINTSPIINSFLKPFENGNNVTAENLVNRKSTSALNYLKTSSSQASVVTLKSLTVSSGVLSPAFSSATLSYTDNVLFAASTLVVTPASTDALATITATVNSVPISQSAGAFNMPLSVGSNTVDILVTGQDGVTKQHYIITVNRAAASNNNNLTNVSVNGTSLTPSGVNYSANVLYAPGTIALIPTTQDPNATILVTIGATVITPVAGTYTVPVALGSNSLNIMVTAEDGTSTNSYHLTITRNAASTINTLSSLTLNSGTLSPSFSTSTNTYAVTVANTTSSMKVTPTVTDATASIAVNGSAVASGSSSNNISLNVGTVTPISVVVTAQDGTKNTYTINVTRPYSVISTLNSILVTNNSQGSITYNGATSYTDYVTNGTNAITVTPNLTDGTANFTGTLNGSAISASGGSFNNVPLNLGNNIIIITVTAQDGITKTIYTLNAYRATSSTTALLNGITVDKGTLSPGFNQTTFSYTDIVANNASSITVTPTLADPTATVRVNSTITTSGTGVTVNGLVVGPNVIQISVTATDGTISNYFLTITKPSTDATLSSLGSSYGSLSPNFTSGTINYTQTVSNGTNNLTISPTVNESHASVIEKYNGNTVTTGSSVTISVGSSNVFTFDVTAQDGVSKQTYTLTVTRPSNDATLSNLVSSAGGLTPGFTSNTTNYSQLVSNATNSITLTPTLNESHASVVEKFNGVTVGTGNALSLSIGSNNIITFLVTAQDGTAKTYTLTVTRASTDATLSSLASSFGSLIPIFTSGTFSYAQTVGNGNNNITITPTVNESHANVVEKFNGTTVTTGSAVTISVGSNNVFTFDVTAQDVTSKQTYTLTVTRPSNDATLSSLTSPASALNPTFTSGTLTYVQTVSNSTTSITVTPNVNESHATVIEKLNGVTVTTGSAQLLNVGSNNIFTFLVTAQDGTAKTYTLTVTRASNDATLSSLVSTGGALNPTFTSGTTAYAQTVSNTTTSITVTPTVSESNATIIEKINGLTVTTGSVVALNLGSNSITFDVTAQDGTTKQTYTLLVTRPSTDATLANLTSAAGALTPGFSPSITTYIQTVSNTTSSITVTPTVNNTAATVKVNGITVTSGTPSASLPLNVGSNTITTVVTAQDGSTTQTYTLTVNRTALSINTLSGLTVSTGALSPSFNSGTTSYTVNVPNGTSSIAVTPTVSDPSATVKVNGTSVVSGTPSAGVFLVIGSTTITTQVTAQDGSTKQYNILVIRASSSVATLNTLVPSVGSLSPTFASATTAYTDVVSNSTTSINLTPTTTDGFATVKVNGSVVTSGSASAAIPLSVGNNTINVAVTSADLGTTITYVLIVYRTPLTIATLNSLTVSSGTLSPSFSSGTNSYNVSVPNSVGSLAVTPTLTDPNSSVKVNGTTVVSGSASSAILLAAGNNTTINVVVTAQDGTTTQTYTIVVNRAASNIASLGNFTISSGSLSPSFNGTNLTYSTIVTNATNTIAITPTATDINAIIKVNGTIVTSGNSSASIPLVVGSNTITTLVTAQDGVTTQTYTLTVNRTPSAIATLNNLTVSSGTLSPGFNNGISAYTVNVVNTVTSINVTPTATDGNATIKVNGTTVTSGYQSLALPLTVGNNTITTIVTAQDGVTQQTYTLTVNRAQSTVAFLNSLVLNNGSLNPSFNSSTMAYTVSVSNSINSITLTPTVAEANATVKVNGQLVTSGNASTAIPLLVGANTITAIVTAQDGTTTQTYTLTVNRSLSTVATLNSLIVSKGSLSPVFFAGTTNYTDNVINSVNNITVTPALTDANAKVTVNGIIVSSGSASGPITLVPGGNTITIVVTAQDLITTQTYTLTVIRAAFAAATLSDLGVNSGTISPTFNSGNFNYTDNVSNSTSSITVTPTLTDATATIKINGLAATNATASSPFVLSLGNNTITIEVTSQDGSLQNTYYLTVNRPKSSVNTLSNLTLNDGSNNLPLGFNSATTSYTYDVANLISSLILTPSVADVTATATVSLNGTALTANAISGAYTIPVSIGANPISILVTAQDGTQKTYSLTVNRASSSVNTLNTLALSGNGILNPAQFAPSINTYTYNVANTTNSITLTPTLTDINATMTVNGKPVATGQASQPINLLVGKNIDTIVVKGQDGSIQKYTITVTRAPSTEASLQSLFVTSGNLTPTFTTDNYTYTENIQSSVNAISVVPILSDVTATVKIIVGGNMTVTPNGASYIIKNLTTGSNNIIVKVTAQDSITQKIYTLSVKQAPPGTNTLSDLFVSYGTLSPAFSSDITSYSETVPNTISTLKLTPTANDNYASVKVNGVLVTSGLTTSPILLNLGNNVINVLVKAQDGTSQTYTLNVNRVASSIATLNNLVVSGGNIVPNFDLGTTAYYANVRNDNDYVNIIAAATDAFATITVNGIPVQSGIASNAIPIVVGNNTITTVVTAQDGITTQIYTTTVNRAPSGAALLSSLLVNSGALTPLFDSGTTSYTDNVPNSTDTITMEPLTNNIYATVVVNVNGKVITSATNSFKVPLQVGNNTVKIIVTAEDKTSQQTYTTIINRAPSGSAYLSNLGVSNGILSPVFESYNSLYTDDVPNATTTFTVIPSLNNPNSSVTVNGLPVNSNTHSQAIPLIVGPNTITMVVTAEDRQSQQTYVLKVNRLPSPVATLNSLILNGATLTMAFDSSHTEYSAILNDNSTDVYITAAVTELHATLDVNGQALASSTTSNKIHLNNGTNKILVTVIAQDGTKKIYTITIIRWPKLDYLEVDNGLGSRIPLLPDNKNNFSYEVTYASSAIKVIPYFSDSARAYVNKSGTQLKSKQSSDPVILTSFIVGTNNVLIQLTSLDGKISITDTLRITRDPGIQSFVFDQLAPVKYGTPDFSPKATVDSKLPINFTSDNPSVATIVNNQIHIVGVGMATITAKVTSNSNFYPAGDINQTLIVNATDQTINIKNNQIPVFVKGNQYDLNSIFSASSNLQIDTFKIINNQLGTIKSSTYIPSQLGTDSLIIIQNGNKLFNKVRKSFEISNTDASNNEIVTHQFVTPNGDGVNDYLVIEGIQELNNNTVKIINRSGVVVYSAKGYDNEKIKFYGHSSNSSDYLPSGTYFYIIDYTNASGASRQKTGFFLLKF